MVSCKVVQGMAAHGPSSESIFWILLVIFFHFYMNIFLLVLVFLIIFLPMVPCKMVQGMAAHGPSSESVIEISATALTPPTNPPEKVRHESVMQLLALAAVQYIVMN